MAGAKTGVHVVQLREIQVPESLIRGNKFIKWDDVSMTIFRCGYHALDLSLSFQCFDSARKSFDIQLLLTCRRVRSASAVTVNTVTFRVFGLYMRDTATCFIPYR